jgi:hypothetical protein
MNSVFGYWDEFYAFLFFPLWLIKSGVIYKKNSFDSKLTFLLIIYIVVGLIPNILYRYAGLDPVIMDIFLNCKFFLGIYTTIFLFRNLNIERYARNIKGHVKFIITILFLLILFDFIFKIFPSDELRYGIRSEQLFYGHPTGLASVSFFLLLLIILFFKNTKSDKVYILISLLILISTLRTKAIVTALIFLYFFYVVVIKKRKINIIGIILVGIISLYIAEPTIYEYFLSSNSLQTARGALVNRSFIIAKDYFPLGTGFATFASTASGTYYSPIYYMYNLNSIWGLMPGKAMYVSDTFWPMILGQTGWLGLIIYLCMLLVLWKKINFKLKTIPILYMTGIGAMLYLLISSMGESAFVNPLSLPLAFILGLSFIIGENKGGSYAS